MTVRRKPALKLTQEELEQQSLDRQLKDCREKYNTKPNRFYSVGERVHWGNHDEVIILEKYDDGICYKVHTRSENQRFGQTIIVEGKNIVSWYEIRTYRPVEVFKNIPIYTKNRSTLQFMQQDIRGLFTYWYHFGVEVNIEYQRPYVWELSDKISLIDSIFNNIEIGKFALIFIGYEGKCYEILDGKQRLGTLIEFFEDRFSWHGRVYSDLHPRDQNHFESYPVSVASSKEPLSDQAKYDYFLRLNVYGKPQSIEHLEKVRQLYEKSCPKII